MSDLKQEALDFHEFPIPGKISVTPTKNLATQHDLALAYSPGVAEPCLEIEKDPSTASRYTARGNLVAVISNGTAVLGLGNIGALASKPVMEGKGVLFKKFAGIDVFDIEINETNPEKLVDIIASLEPTFGGVPLVELTLKILKHQSVSTSKKHYVNVWAFLFSTMTNMARQLLWGLLH